MNPFKRHRNRPELIRRMQKHLAKRRRTHGDRNETFLAYQQARAQGASIESAFAMACRSTIEGLIRARQAMN